MSLESMSTLAHGLLLQPGRPQWKEKEKWREFHFCFWTFGVPLDNRPELLPLSNILLFCNVLYLLDSISRHFLSKALVAYVGYLDWTVSSKYGAKGDFQHKAIPNLNSVLQRHLLLIKSIPSHIGHATASVFLQSAYYAKIISKKPIFKSKLDWGYFKWRSV